MKELKSLNGKAVRVKSFETEDDLIFWEFAMVNGEDRTLFSGTKSELMEKSEEWCQGIVEYSFNPEFSEDGLGKFHYPSKDRNTWFSTAKESLQSVIEGEKGNWITITEEII